MNKIKIACLTTNQRSINKILDIAKLNDIEILEEYRKRDFQNSYIKGYYIGLAIHSKTIIYI